MAILKLPLTIKIVAIMAKITILAILAIAICIINMAILSIQLKSSVVLDSYQSNLLFSVQGHQQELGFILQVATLLQYSCKEIQYRQFQMRCSVF